MKKTLSFIIAAIICICAAAPALADIDTPQYIPIDAHVTNPLGTRLYEAKLYSGNTLFNKTLITIPAGTKITERGEYKSGEDTYAYVIWGRITGYVKAEDIAFDVPEYIPSGSNRLDSKKTVVAIKKTGIPVYSGPSFVYDTLPETVPFGTKLTYEYVDDPSYPTWGYINYNGQAGWVYVMQYDLQEHHEYNCAYTISDNDKYLGKVMVIEDGMRLLAEPEDEAEEIGEPIPEGTELEFSLYRKLPKYIYAYTEYKGTAGWIIADELENGCTVSRTSTSIYTMIYSHEELTVYEKFGDTSSKVLASVPADEVVLSDSYFYDRLEEAEIDGELRPEKWHTWYRVNYDGVCGWILSDETACKHPVTVVEVFCEHKMKKKDDIVIRSAPEKDSAVIGTESVGTTLQFEPIKDELCFVNTGKVVGWADIPKSSYDSDIWEGPVSNLTEAIRAGKLSISDFGIAPEETSVIGENDRTEPGTNAQAKEAEPEKGNGLSPSQIIGLSVAGAAVLAVTAIVVIMLVNKKKKAG